jgi:hypothetical protein
MDQVGEQRDAAAREEHGELRKRRQPEDAQGERDSSDALSRAGDFVVDQAVRVAVIVTVSVRVVMWACWAGVNRLRRSERRQVAMSAAMRVAVHTLAMAVSS